MSSDFRGSNITVRTGSDNWGPFEFDMSGMLPKGTALSNCTVESWQEGTETTSDLIEPDSVTTLDTNVSVRFQCPKDTDGNTIYKGNHVILFHIEVDNGALHTLRFEHVVVE